MRLWARLKVSAHFTDVFLFSCSVDSRNAHFQSESEYAGSSSQYSFMRMSSGSVCMFFLRLGLHDE